jgi:protein-S-isoprenylcysteine O-methyltransferase Ste14
MTGMTEASTDTPGVIIFPPLIPISVDIGMVIGANRIFRRIGTNVNPSQPTVALATTGVFTWTRNPMYVGGSLAILSIAIALAPDLILKRCH